MPARDVFEAVAKAALTSSAVTSFSSRPQDQPSTHLKPVREVQVHVISLSYAAALKRFSGTRRRWNDGLSTCSCPAQILVGIVDIFDHLYKHEPLSLSRCRCQIHHLTA